MDTFESNWEEIKRALMLTVRLVGSFGFTDRSLTAHSAILPIAYYLYKKKPGESFLTHNSFELDRKEIREWLIRSLLKSGIWGSGLDTLLTELRRIIGESDTCAFPVARIYVEMARRGRELVFNDEEVEDLADMKIRRQAHVRTVSAAVSLREFARQVPCRPYLSCGEIHRP